MPPVPPREKFALSSRFSYGFTRKPMIAKKKHGGLISVAVPIIISIVMVPMMVPVPAIFVRVTIMAVAVSVVIVRSVLLVSGVDVNAESVVCFGLGKCHGHQPERRQT
jgi:hypothetical protein